ncbi:hypothetical protein [Mesobacillus harenae]|uniref:hypothetical protein n=1 Tax=Mesobacillus harenae TaxID=2213203 RepID=UPI0015812D6B|nr:hypothetical protein [Mesobacillus harenae]
MNESFESLSTQLRLSREELLVKLEKRQGSEEILPYVIEELEDIERTLAKMDNGEFGRCEISGEFLPEEILFMMPTVKTMFDAENVEKYYRKSIYS